MGNGNKKDESVTRVTLDIHYRVTVIIITCTVVVPVPCRTVHSNSKKMIFLPLPWYSVKNYFIELLFFHLA